jgi:hypothetical protein
MIENNSHTRINTKAERGAFLTQWCLEHPLATIEEARAALKREFNGVAVGTKQIADTLREARQLRLSGDTTKRPTVSQPTLQDKVQSWAREMKAHGVRLVEIRDDGSVRLELAL